MGAGLYEVGGAWGLDYMRWGGVGAGLYEVGGRGGWII